MAGPVQARFIDALAHKVSLSPGLQLLDEREWANSGQLGVVARGQLVPRRWIHYRFDHDIVAFARVPDHRRFLEFRTDDPAGAQAALVELLRLLTEEGS